ncbi:MAG: hypothetical protein ABI369_06830 [Acetobacteraceae bacterium]
MRLSTTVAVLGIAAASAFVAAPTMAQVIIQGGNPVRSEASRNAAHRDMHAAREQERRADDAAASGDYHAAARHQDNAEEARSAAHDERHQAENSGGSTIIVGR